MGLAEKYAAYQAFQENLRGQKLQNDERQRLADLQTGINSAVQNRAQQTTFAEPQQQMAQPLSLSILGRSVNMAPDPNLTNITGRTGQSPELATYEAMRTIDPLAAPDYAAKILKNAHSIAETGDHAGSVEYVNKALGTNLKYLGTKDNIMTIANGDGTHTLYDLTTGQDKVIGTPKPTIVPQGSAISDGKGGWTVPVPKTDPEALLDKRFANQQKLQAEQIAAQDRRTSAQIAAADRRAAQKENGPGKTLPAGQLESIADMKRVKDVLAEANSEMRGVSTGPVSGRLQALGSKVGMADDNFVNLQQKLQTAQNIMLKLRSGAAVTESEYARFLKEYPTPNDAPEVFKRKMQNTLNYANTLMDDKMQIYEEGGYRVPQSVKSGNKPQGNKPTPKPAAKAKRDPLGIL